MAVLSWQTALLVVTLALVHNVSCFPGGAPSSSCGHYLPSHGVGPQPSDNVPYELTASRKYFDLREEGSDHIVVNLTSTSKKHFEGFVVAAYDAEGKPFGQFDATNHAHQIPRCDQPAMTQNSKHHKTHISLVWRPPAETNREWSWMQFKATVVKNYKTFWVGVSSTAPEVTPLTSSLD